MAGRRYHSRWPGHRRVPWALVLILVGLAVASMLLDSRLRPAIETYSGYRAKVFATGAINDAVYAELSGENTRYEAIVTLRQNSGGEVTALQTDMVALNRLRGRATAAVLERLSQMEEQTILVPAGTLSGIQLLSGRGPSVALQVLPAGYLETRVENRFDSAGINQTRHQILLIFDLEVTAILPGYTVTTEASTSFCLAETVIVGTVPDGFISMGGEPSSSIRQFIESRGESGE